MEDEPNQFFATTRGRITAVIGSLIVGAILTFAACGAFFPYGLTWDSKVEGATVALVGPLLGPSIAYQYRDYTAITYSLIGWIFVPLAVIFIRRANRFTCVLMILGTAVWFGAGWLAVRRVLNF